MFKQKESQEFPPLELHTPPTTNGGNPAAQSLTQVACGTEVRGHLQCAGGLQIHGRVEGTLIGEGDVEIGPKGQVFAEVEGRNVTVAGQVKGKIFAEGRVMLLSGARVEGDIHAQSLKIEDSVFFQGGCVMGEGARRIRQTESTPLPATVVKLKVA